MIGMVTRSSQVVSLARFVAACLFGLLAIALLVRAAVVQRIGECVTEALPSKPTSSIRIVSHNVGQTLAHWNQIEPLLSHEDVDVVFLQEVPSSLATQVVENFKTSYPFQARGSTSGPNEIGMMTLSRYPILSTNNLRLDAEGLVEQQRLLINMRGHHLIAYNIHTTFPWLRFNRESGNSRGPSITYDDSVRGREIARLLQLVDHETLPVILAGDFNLTDHSGDYRSIAAVLTDSHKSTDRACYVSWPARSTPAVKLPFAIPIVKIDYIFHTQEFTTRASYMMKDTGSDHMPIAADIMLR